MKDIIGREIEVGDKILFIITKNKLFSITAVTGFTKQFGKPAITTNEYLNTRIQSEVLILKKADGTVYFNTEGLLFNSKALKKYKL